MRRATAFTLLELIAAMLVIATVLAMAAPSLRGFFAARRTEGAARHLLATTRFARSAAIADGQTYCLLVRPGDDSFQLVVREGGDDRRLATAMGRPNRLPTGVTVSVSGAPTTGGAAELLFHPTGACTAAAIRIEGRQDDTYLVRCASPTEQFTMQRIADP